MREEFEHRRRQCLDRDEVLGLQSLRGKPANRQQRAVDRQWRNDGVDARAVLEPRVDHRRAVVHASSDAADDAIDDAQEMAIVLKAGRDTLETAAALDEDMPMRVHEDVADGRIPQQRLEWSEPEHVVEHFREEHLALREAERRQLLGEQLRQQRADFGLRTRAIRLRQRLEIQAIEQLAMHVRAEIEILRAKRLRAIGDCGGIHGAHHSDARRLKPSIELERRGAPLVSGSVADGRNARVSRSSCTAMSLLPASVSGTPELIAIATVR